MNENLSLLLGLGPNAEWPHSEQALIELIQLQREKEITKQLYYKTENINKSIELLNTCQNANIPSYLIPMVFSSEGYNQDTITKIMGNQNDNKDRTFQQQHQQPSSQPSSPTKLPHLAKPTVTHLAPPVSLYRTRPLSPAKIGAAAVEQLDRGRYPTSPMHRRNISLPASAIKLGTPSSKSSFTSNLKHNQSNTHNTPPAATSQRSMMNTLSVGAIQFVNENPGKKRRRSSSDKQTTADKSPSDKPQVIQTTQQQQQPDDNDGLNNDKENKQEKESKQEPQPIDTQPNTAKPLVK